MDFSALLQSLEIAKFQSPYSVRIHENMDQKKLLIWTLFTQCLSNEYYIKGRISRYNVIYLIPKEAI